MRKTNETRAPKYYKCFHIREILPLLLLYMSVIKLLEMNKKKLHNDTHNFFLLLFNKWAVLKLIFLTYQHNSPTFITKHGKLTICDAAISKMIIKVYAQCI